MRWQREAPTTPGIYYWQGGRLVGKEVAVVQVTAFKNLNMPLVAEELCTTSLGQPYKTAPDIGPVKSWGGIWAGPLPQPQPMRG